IDQTDSLFQLYQEAIQSTSVEFELVLATDSEEESIQAVKDGNFKALVVLSLNEEQLPEATFYANQITHSRLQMELEQQLQQLKTVLVTEQAGIDQETMTRISEPVGFHVVALDEAAKTEEELSQARGIVYIMLFLLYMAVI